jgi:hypothetical protein
MAEGAVGTVEALTSRVESGSREDGRWQPGGSSPRREEISPDLLTGRLEFGYSQQCNR